jgi:hypothetical protein
MSQESAFRPEYGLIGAGAVNASLIGRIPGKARALGPVAATSFRVASRIANTLRAGNAVRSADELDSVRIILFHAPPDQMESLTCLLREADIRWAGKSLIICDCEDAAAAGLHFRTLGASVALLRGSGVPGRVVVEGTAPATTHANGFARSLRMKAVQIGPGCEGAFDAAIMLGGAALTPLIDHAANLFRQCGVRDADAVKMAAAVFEQTARDYAHSGKQSWAWHKREPNPERIIAQLGAVDSRIKVLMAELMLLGFDGMERHPAAAKELRAWLDGRGRAIPSTDLR